MREVILIGEYEYQIDREKENLMNGHIYCKTCGERIDAEPIELFNTAFIPRMKCLCERKQDEEQERLKRKQQVMKLKESCFKSNVQWNYRFDSFKGEKTQTYRIAINYCREFEEMKQKNIGLIFFGNVGSGKSFLASCIANYLIEEELLPVKMRNFSEIINDLQSGGFSLDRNKYIESLVNVPLLILDDLGIERDTAYAKEQVYNIVNSRYLKHKPTIITTNLPWDVISNEDEDLEYQRIYSRIVEMCVPIRVKAADYRKSIQRSKMKDIQERLSDWR